MEKSNYIAPCRTIYLGETSLKVAPLANGDYRLSQTEVAEAISLEPNSISQFFESQYFQALSDKSFDLEKSEEPLLIEGSNQPINPISINLASLYWQTWAIAGNEKAQGLVVAMLQHTLQKQSIPETPTIRELKLRIQLAELELEKARIQQRLLEKAHKIENPEDYEFQRLKFKSLTEAEQFIRENFGEEGSKWIPLEISGEILIVPWGQERELPNIYSQFNAELN